MRLTVSKEGNLVHSPQLPGYLVQILLWGGYAVFTALALHAVGGDALPGIAAGAIVLALLSAALFYVEFRMQIPEGFVAVWRQRKSGEVSDQVLPSGRYWHFSLVTEAVYALVTDGFTDAHVPLALSNGTGDLEVSVHYSRCAEKAPHVIRKYTSLGSHEAVKQLVTDAVPALLEQLCGSSEPNGDLVLVQSQNLAEPLMAQLQSSAELEELGFVFSKVSINSLKITLA